MIRLWRPDWSSGHTLPEETLRMIRFNRKNVFLFELLFRLVTTILYLLILGKGLQFALKMAGYSYLTPANAGSFLLRPWTVLTVILLIFWGILILTLETGCLLTLFQGVYYSRKLKPGEALAGGLFMLFDEMKKKNWRLGLLILCNYIVTNLYLIYLFLTHIKPMNFVMSEILKQFWGRTVLTAALTAVLVFSVPGLYCFYTCMIEQKNFRDGYLRSRWLIRRRFFKIIAVQCGFYAAAVAAMKLVYAFSMLVMAMGMTLFTDNRLALAILPTAGGRIELVLIFFTSMCMAIGNFAALSVQYFRFSGGAARKSSFAASRPRSLKGWRVALAAGIVTAGSLFSLFDVVRNGSAVTGDILNPIAITAHRGSSAAAPENTMASMEKAVEDLADFVEIDVQETKDGVVVLGHDTSLKRVAGVSRPISDYTLEELEKLEVGKWHSEEYAGERIPTLEEVLDYCKGKLKVNIELKNLGADSDMPDKVVALIEKRQMKEQCLVTSVRLSYLSRVKELNPDIHTGYIVSAAYGNYYSSDYIDFVSLRSSFVTEHLVESAHEKGKAVHAWTVNSKGELERMKMLGVDNIITDYPVLAREIVYREEATENLMEYLRLIFK